jgi:hypothetical protein
LLIRRKVWFPFSEGELQPKKLTNRDHSLEFDTEVYPVGTPLLCMCVG